MDCGLLGFSVHGIPQARILQCTAISFSRGSSQPSDQTHISCMQDSFNTEPPGKPTNFQTFILIKDSEGSKRVSQVAQCKDSTCQCRRHPWVGKIPWRGEWLPTPVFLPGEFHGQRGLADYTPWGRKELDTTEQLSLSFSTPGLSGHGRDCILHTFVSLCSKL